MLANRYLHIAVIGAILLFLGMSKHPGKPGLPGCLAKVSQLEERIEELEAMLENFAAVPQTGQTVAYASADDGDLQMGVRWPDPRFTDNGDGTVTDNLTGLIWLKDARCLGEVYNWSEALEACNNLPAYDGQCGLSDGSTPGDWRLPNDRELHSLIDVSSCAPALPKGHPFQRVQAELYYWSSTTSTCFPSWAMRVEMFHGDLSWNDKDKQEYHFVWPVRGGN